MDIFSKTKISIDDLSKEHIYSKEEEPINIKKLNQNLRKLVIIEEPLSNISEIESLEFLNDLWLVKCSILNADQAHNCQLLQKLYLYNNNLTRIPAGISSLRHLQILWLAGNAISKVEKQDLPSGLLELNIADNRITTIKNTFEYCPIIHELNLSGNPLKSIFEVYHLQVLKSLKSLCLCDSMYESSVITNMINYRSFVIMALPNLQEFDSFTIEEHENELTKLHFLNKYNYYRKLSIDALFNYYCDKEFENKKVFDDLGRLKRILCALYYIQEKALQKIDEKTVILCKNMQTHFGEEIDKLEKKRAMTEVKLYKHLKVKFINFEMELESFGSIKFHSHEKDSELALLCEETLNSFLCPHIKKKFSLNSIKVCLVTQIMNSMFYSHYQGEVLRKISTGELSLDLFIICEPVSVQSNYEDFLSNTKKSFCESGMISLTKTVTSCIGLADSIWLKTNIDGKKHNKDQKAMSEERHVSLAFVDQEETTIVKNYRKSKSHHISEQCVISNVTYPQDINPLFLVEYHYIFENEKSNEDGMKEYLIREGLLIVDTELLRPPRSDVHDVFEIIKPWDNLSTLTIVNANLTNFGLNKKLPNVKELDISYNKMQTLTEVCRIFPNLALLLAPFNEIASLPQPFNMYYLKKLDLSWNSLTSFMDTSNWIKSSATAIEIINLKFNYFSDINDTKHESLLMFKHFNSLQMYNNISRSLILSTYCERIYTLDEYSVREFSTTEIPADFFEPKDGINHLSFIGENCHNDIKKSHLAVNSNKDIICVYFTEGKQFYDIKFEVPVKNITSLTITKNKLKNTDFLIMMLNLQELDLSFNLLESVSGNLFSLINIVRLNLSCNYIKSIEDFKNLEFPFLKFLDLSKNLLKNLHGIEGAKNINELHASFNQIHEVEQFAIFKNCKNLKIFDVRNNRIEIMDILRNYLIYCIPSLEYINGQPVTDIEINEANNTTGGILDIDYLKIQNNEESNVRNEELNISNASIKTISLKGSRLEYLTSVNLENNGLSAIMGLVPLENLKFLNLTGNQINKFGKAAYNDVFKKLQELHLDMNGLTNLEPLELFRMPKLKTLFLQDNTINEIKGIKSLVHLEHLILDRNRITNIDSCEVKTLCSLQVLFLESNSIERLDFLASLKTVNRLFLKHNKIQEVETLHFLKHLTMIQELSFSGNPICKANECYVKILTYLPNINSVDGYNIELPDSVSSNSTATEDSQDF